MRWEGADGSDVWRRRIGLIRKEGKKFLGLIAPGGF